MQTGTYDPNGLLAGHLQAVHETVTILSGQNLKRGAVVGRVTASGKYVLSLSAAENGSEDPVGILATDCYADGADKEAPVFFMGEFNAAECVFGADHTAATATAAFRAASAPIFIRTLAPTA